MKQSDKNDDCDTENSIPLVLRLRNATLRSILARRLMRSERLGLEGLTTAAVSITEGTSSSSSCLFRDWKGKEGKGRSAIQMKRRKAHHHLEDSDE